MTDESPSDLRRDFEDRFEDRYEWRREHEYERYQELCREDIAGPNGVARRTLRLLSHFESSDDTATAYRRTIMFLWGDAQESYVYGTFLACILACGALAERCLKLDYIEKKKALPAGKWTLGKIINTASMKSTIDEPLLVLADELLSPRNSMAHAVLEHEDPELAITGGHATRTPVIDHHYIIQPYRLDALQVLRIAAKIMLHQFTDSTLSEP